MELLDTDEDSTRPDSARTMQCLDCARVVTIKPNRKRCNVCAYRSLRDARYRGRVARKLREKLQKVEVIDRNVVLDGGNWTCGLCANPIDRDLVYPHPASPSIDHITPLSKGGAHAYVNLQPSHLCCNLRKGDRQSAA